MCKICRLGFNSNMVLLIVKIGRKQVGLGLFLDYFGHLFTFGSSRHNPYLAFSLYPDFGSAGKRLVWPIYYSRHHLAVFADYL